MHILLTDILVCPRCGPQFGLILLADRIEQRRVLDGRLGCANCRETYDVRNGAGYFGGDPLVPAGDASTDDALRLAALMGLVQGSTYALLAGPAAVHAAALASLLDGLEVITIAEAGSGSPPDHDTPGITRLGIAARIPLSNMRIAGVALTGALADGLLEEGARVLSARGRLLLEPAPPDAPERLAAVGLQIVARDGVTVVATRA